MGVRLDPTPLFYENDRDYALLFQIVTDATIEEHNRVHGG